MVDVVQVSEIFANSMPDYQYSKKKQHAARTFTSQDLAGPNRTQQTKKFGNPVYTEQVLKK